jgi:hypothetical protein
MNTKIQCTIPWPNENSSTIKAQKSSQASAQNQYPLHHPILQYTQSPESKMVHQRSTEIVCDHFPPFPDTQASNPA